uniref:G_PROTEIN_RECEP_F1_2 domain-containing protein n=1 Tax=Panagrellus redivivus TaxID=6233 RepID=A0A7E4ZWS3_PANRE
MQDEETLRVIITAETGDVLKPYFGERSLIYVGEINGLTRTFCLVYTIYLVILSLIVLGIVIWFSVNVFIRRNSSQILSKTAMSLIVSSLVQGFLCFALIFIPVISLCFVWAFEIENSANFINTLFLLVTFHGTVDLISILWFVKPYRRYCGYLIVNFFLKIYNIKKVLLYFKKA